MVGKPTYEELEQKVQELEKQNTVLKQNEDQFQLFSSLVKQSDQGMAVVDLNGHVVFINKAFAGMHGFTPEELVGKHLSVFHTSEQMPSIEAANRLIKDTGAFKGEIWHLHKNGTTFPTLMHNSLLKDEGGNAIGMIGTLLEITEIKRTEEALRESEKRFRLLVESSPDAIFVQIEGRFAYLNEAAVGLFGANAAEDLKGKSVIDRFHPEFHEIVRERIRLLNTEKVSVPRIEEIYLRMDGTSVYVEVSAVPICYQGSDGALVFVRDITERICTEDALRESEERYRNFFDNALAGFFRSRLSDGMFIEMNSKAAELLGLPVEEVVGKVRSADLYRNPGQRRELISKLKQDGGVHGFEADLTLHDGRDVIFSISVKSYPDKDYMEGAVIDITERKLAEAALRESEEKYRSMMESIKAAVYICAPDFRIEYMNLSMIKRTGRDDTGEVCHKAIHNLNERCPWCVYDKIQQGESVETEILSPKDNRYYSVSHSPIFHQDGSISKMTINRDITESKKAEVERIRLATAIEQASESIIISDSPGAIQYVNPAFEQLSGFNREEIIGQNFRILKSDKHDEAFYREMYDIISRGHTWAGRIINTMKNGTLREFETRISPVKDSSGEIINFVSVNRDITQEKALEAQLQHAQRMDAIGTLAGGVAHDFNNILSAVIGYTELALDDAEKGTLQYKNLQEILVAGGRAKDLVQQILTFSRQSDQEQKPVNVQLIAKEALKLLRASIPSTIEIKKNIQSEALVMGDSTQIHQVLMNLCTNAAHAMDDKGGVLTVALVDIKLDSEFIYDYPDLKPGTYINLTVTDTGYGMAPDVSDKIFDPFFTTKEKGKGTGMGLSVVHGIVHSHGGSIYAFSEPGKGSTFRVLLPVLKRRLESEERIEKPIPTGTERILFVDDELSIVNIGKQTLESLGYDVVTRTSSIEALEFFKTQPDSVDIVITDLTMPNMTGEELAKELMQIRPDIPIILCTGFSARMDEQKAMAMGIRAFVSKPILKREIAETIRKVIDSS